MSGVLGCSMLFTPCLHGFIHTISQATMSIAQKKLCHRLENQSRLG